MSSPKKRHKPPPEMINTANFKHNFGVLGFFRTFVSVITGTVIGILGVQGWWGFIPHFVTQLLCVFAMFLKGATNPKLYFNTWFSFLFFNVFSSITLLSYMLFWMTFFNITHVFA
ncbi:hypothetical protein CEUSTIGMA_g304.t1 [Chlamydomonas eustigma]|uniref:ER membrane protein complex subunit 6 n=1 Tax=Chlamydomonas eustigma TaxID=1157962 RepID=A0A250WQ79_9CHLO|nr:hypothetical protein CEUSTIGMA_g304.t1 [Chlamydomonas eustigma]|eukprot:GAX72849.1 hypothetical protein CEUSTIGMA_g304.t1 [Chlamydomonas eustigma]